jgi:hypothetical protein
MISGGKEVFEKFADLLSQEIKNSKKLNLKPVLFHG